jgi:hypothetical protein
LLFGKKCVILARYGKTIEMREKNDSRRNLEIFTVVTKENALERY